MNEMISLIHSSSFYELASLLVLSALAGIIGTYLRQPLIIAFIFIGVLVSPAALGIVQTGDEIALLAKLGIAILLFIVGLKLDLKLIKSLGTIAAFIGTGQIILTVLIAFGLSYLIGFNVQEAFLIAIALAFSSTIIIIKILSDKREIDSLHGRITLGVLIVQDLAVVFSMIVLAAFSSTNVSGEDISLLKALFEVAIYTVILLTGLALFMRFVALKIMGFIAKNQELLLCCAIAWAISLAALCDVMGLSKELGGLLAGVSLASTPYREAIISRLASLRDFLLLFFFVSLGTQIDISVLGDAVVPAIILSIFVMLFKPFIVMGLCRVLGYRKRTGFMAGLALAQISEFSLIFAAMAYSAGFMTQEVLSLITLVGIITIVCSTYLISLSEGVYRILQPYLSFFETNTCQKEQEDDAAKIKKSYDIILFGLGRYGQAMAKGFINNGKSVLAIDFNPEEVRRWRTLGHDVMYGDAKNSAFFHAIPLKDVQWVISALPQHNTGITHEDPRMIIIDALKHEGYQGNIAVACHHVETAQFFQNIGVSKVFLPFHDAAQRAVEIVLDEIEKD
tara:strand:- start:558 stop:2252 length:1695 start_codon:yes stop_codon:yes gene_type:complete